MEEQEYKRTFNNVNQHPCLFGRAMLAGYCGCQHAQRLLIAEREAMTCLNEAAWQHCQTQLSTLQDKSRFVFKNSPTGNKMPYAQALRLQGGGLRGLRSILPDNNPQASTDTNVKISDVADLLAEVKQQFPQSETIAYGQVIQVLRQFKGRKPRRKH